MTFCALLAAAQIGGVFPLLCTPYSEDGSLDCETLAKEAMSRAANKLCVRCKFLSREV